MLNRAIAGVQGDQNRYNESVPCLVEKARVMANRGDWAQAEVMAHRVLDEQDRGNVCSCGCSRCMPPHSFPPPRLAEVGAWEVMLL